MLVRFRFGEFRLGNVRLDLSLCLFVWFILLANFMKFDVKFTVHVQKIEVMLG
jgi:hypothetical protein